ncbi:MULTISPECIES: hypothetical protein [Sorangium]|uniref:Uncharacterized protein n=1 Tax=Sorangium cellulosum (strain So ce56) TaxID=448385 RepID=A9EYA1_SORC5|nr:hypothetical protein [Sorangium cellulosum]CAN97524.1 hypothetical protein predicted by Glimmer/Critica [Sorangium cellulosum So ce56]
MIPALTALKAAAAALLEARGERGLSALVAGGELALAAPPQRWTLGSREVSASRLSLAVDAPEFAALTADPSRLAAVKEAFASAVRTPETELADLSLVLRLPGVGRGWSQIYREAALPAAPERPAPDAVLGGAAALLEASGDARGAAMLRRARLEAAQVASGGAALVRCVVRLEPADRAALDRDGERAERLRRAVRDAGTRASEAIASVELATALYPLGGAAAPEARLARALAARGAVAVTIRRGDGPEGEGVELAVVASGELMRVRITAAPEREHGGWRAEGIRAITVTAGDLATPERTEELAALLCGGGELP